MAANIFTGATNSDCSTATNWSLGSVPTASDGNVATFTVTSPACSLSANVTFNNLDFTGYINNINLSTRTITVGGNLTFGSGMTTSGTGTIQLSRAATITSNGYIFPYNFGTTSQQDGTTGSYTVTFADNFECLGNLSIGSSLSPAGMNLVGVGLTLRFGGNLSVFGNGNRTLGGSIKLIATGSGSLSTGVNSWIGNEFEINASGTYTFGSLFYIRGKFTYIAGTTDTGTGTVAFGATTFDINVNGDTNSSATVVSSTGINFYNLNTTLGGSYTLVTPIRVINVHTHGGATFSSGNIYNKGSIALTINTPVSSVVMIFDGTGSWSGNFNARNKFVINTTGTFTLNGTLATNTGFHLQYISGTTVCNGVLTLGAVVTLDVNGDSSPSATTTSTTGINFNNLISTASASHIVTGDIRICGTHTHGGSNFGTGKNIYNNGSLSVTTNTGAALYNYYMDGTGTITTSGAIRHNLILNTTGTITFTSLTFGGIAGATLTYIPNTGTVSAGTLLLGNLGIATTLNTNVLNFSTVQFQGTPITTTLNSTLNCTNCIFIVNSTFAGSFGINANNMTCTVAGTTITLKDSINYTVINNLTLTGTTGSKITVSSSSATLRANLILNNGATQSVTFTNATRIDSSGGQNINTNEGTLTNTINWSVGLSNFFLMF